jgi:hypothetical protein
MYTSLALGPLMSRADPKKRLTESHMASEIAYRYG